MFQKHLLKKLLLVFFLTSLTACEDREEIENKSYVIAIGIDQSDKDHLLRVSYLIANPEYGSLQEGGGEGTPPKEIITVNAPDVISTKDLMNTMIPKDLTFELLSHIMISEKLAKSELMLPWMYDAAKDTEVRRDISLVITKEAPEQFFTELNPKFELRPHKYLKLITEQGEKIGYTPPNSQLLQYYRILEAKGDLFMASYATTQVSDTDEVEEPDRFLAGELGVTGDASTTQFAGSAIFKDGVMVGKLNSEETRLAILLNNTLLSRSYMMIVTDPFDESLNMTIKVKEHKKNKTKMTIKDEQIHLKVTIPINISILTNHSMANYDKSENRDKLKSHLESRFDRKFDDLVHKTIHEFGGQPFGWSLIARKQFQTIQAYNAFNFAKQYPNINVDIKTEIKVSEFGRQKTIPKAKEIQDND